MYSAGQIGLATFLGGAWTGLALMGMNEQALGNRRRSLLLWFGGCCAFIALCGAALTLPVQFLRSLPAVLTVVLYKAAKTAYAERVQSHHDAGGRVASNWRVLGIAIVSLMATVAFGVEVYVLRQPAQFTANGKDVVFYRDGAVSDDARRLAQVLATVGYFDGQGAGVYLHKQEGHFVIDVMLNDDQLKNPQAAKDMKELFHDVDADGFAGSAYGLCNGQFEEQVKVEP